MRRVTETQKTDGDLCYVPMYTYMCVFSFKTTIFNKIIVWEL